VGECGCVYISLVIHCSVAVEDAHYSDKGSVCVCVCICVYVCMCVRVCISLVIHCSVAVCHT
jgi:hypothetical protein